MEWTSDSDCWEGDCSNRGLLGGSWMHDYDAEILLRVRVVSPAGYRSDWNGFRVSRTLD